MSIQRGVRILRLAALAQDDRKKNGEPSPFICHSERRAEPGVEESVPCGPPTTEGVTIPGVAERSESSNKMLAGGKHTATSKERQ